MIAQSQDPHFVHTAQDRLSRAQVTIVGLGLMGASLAAGLQDKCRKVVGVARREETLRIALDRGMIDEGTSDLAAGVAEADVVILATPVRVILRQVGEIGPLLPEGCLLMDLGSTKGQIVEAMAKLPPHVQPLGGHPMCGKEKSGIEVAEPEVYHGATFILSPLDRTSEATLDLGRALVEACGATPLVVEARRQDFLVATLSHLPYMLACSLVNTADSTTSADPLAWKIVAGGYRDTSRVAGSDVTMMVDILLTNRDEVIKAMRTCTQKMRMLTDLVSVGDEETLQRALGTIRDKRREMFP